MMQSKAVKVRLSYDPISPQLVDGIFIEDVKVAFVLTEREEDEAENGGRLINPKRFVRADKLRGIRGELRYASRLYRDALEGALHALSEAKVYHFLLEDIYKNAMDFAALTEFTRTFAASLD